jgi:hypothetical protein
MKYSNGEVFCPICHKQLTEDQDIERGYHFHCRKSEVLCNDKKKKN